MPRPLFGIRYPGPLHGTLPDVMVARFPADDGGTLFPDASGNAGTYYRLMPGRANALNRTTARVRPLTAGTISAGAPGDRPISGVIRDELAAVRKNRADLMIPASHPAIQLIIILVCVLTNIAFFLARPDYFGLFIAASFYLNMYYFITLLLPTNFEKTRLPAADLPRLHLWLKEIGIPAGTKRFTRLFINALFMNSRGLSPGIGLIFTIDMAFALVHYSQGLPFRTTAVVIAQCAIIVIFYLLVWKMEPFSTTYVRKVEQVKSRLRRQNLPPPMVAAVFLFGFLLAVFLFLTTIIYLPGVTLDAFLNQSELRELGPLFSLLAILAVSQYFIIRSIHGITSKEMARRLFDFKEQSLRDLLGAGDTAITRNAGLVSDPLEESTLLLESKIFMVKRSTLAGFFPVFIMDLDFSVLMDTTTLTAIQGYIVEKQEPGG